MQALFGSAFRGVISCLSGFAWLGVRVLVHGVTWDTALSPWLLTGCLDLVWMFRSTTSCAVGAQTWGHAGTSRASLGVPEGCR